MLSQSSRHYVKKTRQKCKGSKIQMKEAKCRRLGIRNRGVIHQPMILQCHCEKSSSQNICPARFKNCFCHKIVFKSCYCYSELSF